MNRRKFIKITGMGVAAFGSGIGVGNLLKNCKEPAANFSVFAFLPGDKETIFNCLKLFRTKINNLAFNDYVEKKNISALMSGTFVFVDKANFFSQQYYDIKLIKISQKVRGDIFISNNSQIILDPSKDFESGLLQFRDSINKKTGNYLLSIELKERNILSKLMISKNKFVKIENSSGLFDKILLKDNYSSVIVPGSIGKTELLIKDGRIRIKSSPCRHKLCMIMSELPGNNMIACVPNKVLITLS